MARELSQTELLDFLCQAGGRVTNAALLSHFKCFLRDPSVPPGQLQQRREQFKRFVNSVASVRQDLDGTKCVVLKKRYRDLVGEEGPRGPRRDPQPAASQQQPRPPGTSAAASSGSRQLAPRLRQQHRSQQRQLQPGSPQQPPQPQPLSRQQQPQLQLRSPQPRSTQPRSTQQQPQPQPGSSQQQLQPQPRSLQQQPQAQPGSPQQQQQPWSLQQQPQLQPRTPQQQPQPQPQQQEYQPWNQPQRVRRQPREKEPETELTGAVASAPEIECNGVLASPGDVPESTERGRKGGRCSLGRMGEAAAAGPSPQARVRCAAGGAQGGCCWECVQDSPWVGSPEPLLSRGSPSLEEGQTLEPSSGGPLQCTPHAGLGSSTKASPLAPETFPAPGTGPSLASLAFPGDGSELSTPNGPHSYAAQQQQRTREWVASHSQLSPDSVAERTQQGTKRFWCVLPENFPELPYHWAHPASEPLPPPLPASPSILPAGPSVFRSIRGKLELQDLENFVEEDSHDSEESTSSPKESPGELEEAPKIPLENGGQEKLRTPGGHFPESQQENTPLNQSQGPILRSSYSPQHIPERVNDPVFMSAKTPRESSDLPQDSMPTVKLRRSLRRSSRAERDKISSSDEELQNEDLVKRTRRPPRSRRLSRAEAVPCPNVDSPLILKLPDLKALSAWRRAGSIWAPRGDVSSVLLSLRPSVQRSSLVPLESREHEWIVRLASGSWVQALSLFWEDPQLALRKDFLTGYTVLHWIAKHGALHALQELVKGAQKAGIILDVNVRSNCGYTPLHLAAIHGHQGIIKLLVQRLESRVNVRDSSGKKPWQYLTSNTTGEIWQLLGAPKGKPIFPVSPLVPAGKAKSNNVSRNISRKTSLAALLKNQHSRWKMAHQYDKFRIPEEYSD